MFGNLHFFIVALTACGVSFTTHAQTYPNKPVRVVVPYPPGGAGDIIARTIGQKLSQAWSQQVVVENRPGAAGMIGAVRKFDPEMIVIFMAESPGLAFGKTSGLRVAAEGYVDRGYDRTGRLVPRDHPQALLKEPAEAAQRIEELVCEGKVTCVDGTRINLAVDTVCLHSDTMGAGAIAAAVANALKSRGVSAAALTQP